MNLGIQSVLVNPVSGRQKNNSCVQMEKTQASMPQGKEVDFKGSQALKALALSNISFKSNTNTIPSELLIEPSQENGEQKGISNLLALKSGLYTIPDIKLDININKTNTNTIAQIKKAGKPFLEVKQDNRLNKPFELEVTEGKDGLITKLNTSEFKAVLPNTLELIEAPGLSIKRYDNPSSSISFTGNNSSPKLFPVLAFMPDASLKALDKSLKEIEKYTSDTSLNKTKDDVLTPQIAASWNIIPTVGGFGTRAASITPPGSNKPAIPTPAGLPLLAFSLIPVVQAGLRLPNNLNDVNSVCEKDSAVGTAGGVIEGIRNKVISTDKNALIVPGDSIHDIKLAPAIKKFEDSKNAGIMVVGNKVPEDQIKDFGIIGTDKDSAITSFIEKPKNPELAKEGKIEGSSEYLANVAIYALKPKLIDALVSLEPIVKVSNIELEPKLRDGESQGSKGKEYDFGKHVLPTLQVLCNSDILDKNGAIDSDKFKNVIKSQDDNHPLKKLIVRSLHDKQIITPDELSLDQKFKQDKAGNLIEGSLDYEKIYKNYLTKLGLSKNDSEKKDFSDERVNKGFKEAIEPLNQVIDTIKGEDGQRLKMIAYVGDGDWADVGTIPAAIQTMKDMAGTKKFNNLPSDLVKKTKENVELNEKGATIYLPSPDPNKDSKKSFKEFIGNDVKVKGDLVVIGK